MDATTDSWLVATEQMLAFNATAAPYPRNAAIHDLFARQAAAAPDQPALVDDSGTLTYRELDERSRALAAQLVGRGVRPGEIVAVQADRGLGWVVANLAVLRAGGAYLPISPAEPAERMRYLIEDSGARQMVTAEEALAAAGHADLPLVPATSRAYVMYTSGSTGRPKGVLVSHRSVVRLVVGSGFVDFSPRMRVLQTGAVSFDATTFEVWGGLLNGGTVVFCPDDTLLDPVRLGAVLRDRRITTMWLTSPLFSQVVQFDPAVFAPLRELLVGGDVVVGDHVAAVLRACPELRILNGYGPTENTT